MVLAYHGKTHREAEIAEAYDTVPLRGTKPENAVAGVQKLGYRALWFENADLKRLESLIGQKWPVIVFLCTNDLPRRASGPTLMPSKGQRSLFRFSSSHKGTEAF